jgi:hypothetical protein
MPYVMAWGGWGKEEGGGRMNRRMLILWGLGAGQLFVAAIAVVSIEHLSNDWLLYLCIGIVFGQSYLAGVWIACGHRSMPWRLLGVAGLLVGLTWIPAWQLSAMLTDLSPATIVVLAFLLPLRVIGFRVCDGIGERKLNDSRRLQFSLRSILEWTAASAMFCSLAALVQPQTVTEIWALGWDRLLLIHCPFAGTCVAELAIILGMRRPWIGFTVLVPIVVAIAGLIGWAQDELEGFLSISFFLMLWFAVSFVPLRLLGYRFGRSRAGSIPLPQSTPQDGPPLE